MSKLLQIGTTLKRIAVGGQARFSVSSVVNSSNTAASVTGEPWIPPYEQVLIIIDDLIIDNCSKLRRSRYKFDVHIII